MNGLSCNTNLNQQGEALALKQPLDVIKWEICDMMD